MIPVLEVLRDTSLLRVTRPVSESVAQHHSDALPRDTGRHALIRAVPFCDRVRGRVGTLVAIVDITNCVARNARAMRCCVFFPTVERRIAPRLNTYTLWPAPCSSASMRFAWSTSSSTKVFRSPTESLRNEVRLVDHTIFISAKSMMRANIVRLSDR